MTIIDYRSSGNSGVSGVINYLNNVVTNIPRNKHTDSLPDKEREVAYNAGRVIVKCFINKHCPILKGRFQDASLVFNDFTGRSFPPDVFANLRFVPGLAGAYIRESYNYKSNFVIFFPYDGSSLILEEHYIRSGFDVTLPPYFYEQSWTPVPSPIDGLRVPNPNEYIGNKYIRDPEIEAMSKVRWRHLSIPRPSDASPIDPKVASSEPINGNIFMPAQDAVGAKDAQGIHWKMRKNTLLYGGEDFFIEFRSTAIEHDIKNIESMPFFDEEYDFLDVNTEDPLKHNISKLPPINQALVVYNKKTDKSGNVIFEKETGSGQRFDFDKQSYLIVEINGLKIKYFIIFANKFYPTFIKVVDGITYNLGVYEGISCKELMGRESFRMTLRNHLGKIVITFTGLEDKPWIIYNKEKFEGEDVIFRIPKKSVLDIWGGNIKTGFLFAPLQYLPQITFGLPPEPKESVNVSQEATKPNPFALPDNGSPIHYMLLSTYDSFPSAFTESGKLHDYGPSFLIDRDPFFTCDTQYIEEPIIGPSGYGTEQDCHFINSKDYIKDIINVDTDTGEIRKIDLSRIILESKQVDPPGKTDVDSGLGLSAETIKEGDNEKIVYYETTVKLGSGNEKFDNNNAPILFQTENENSNKYHYYLENCKTPIITHFRILSNPDDEALWNATEVDVSPHVLKFSDSWTAQDYNTCEHSGTISFIVNDLNNPTELNQSDFLEGLKDRAFYIEVWAGYDGCSYTFGGSPNNKDANVFRLFTGLCLGGTVVQEPVKRVMECKIHDFSKILQDSLFFNSPFFDGMRDINAVYEILNIAGFRKDHITRDGADPGYYVREKSLTASNNRMFTADGRNYYYSNYALPFSYDRIQNPFLRFKDGTKLYDAITDFAKKSSRMMFFDTHGIFHYEDSAGIFMSNVNNDQLSDYSLWEFTTAPDNPQNSVVGQLVFNTMTKEGAVEDIYNNIHILSSTPNFELIIADKINWSSMEDPSEIGFLGYRKTLLQQESLFGNVQSVERIMSYYSSIWKPPVVYKFETFGQPIRIFDIATIDGVNIVLTNISSEIDPQENRWWQTLQGEYLRKQEEELNI